MNDEDMERYCKHMEEIKWRVKAVDAILQKRRTTLYQPTNIEFMCLQIRKILELIALGSLVADEKEYEKQIEHLGKRRWNAKFLLKEMKKINPNFYPVPAKGEIDPQTREVKTTKIKEKYLTYNDFYVVYGKCSGVIHSHPFKNKGECESLENEICTWTNKIITFLNFHQIQLLNEKEQLWVSMNNPDGKVIAYPVVRVDGPT